MITKEYFDWKNYKPVKPAVEGVKVFKEFDLGTIAKYIDWGPFFIAWEMPGRFPRSIEPIKYLVQKQPAFIMMRRKW